MGDLRASTRWCSRRSTCQLYQRTPVKQLWEQPDWEASSSWIPLSCVLVVRQARMLAREMEAALSCVLGRLTPNSTRRLALLPGALVVENRTYLEYMLMLVMLCAGSTTPRLATMARVMVTLTHTGAMSRHSVAPGWTTSLAPLTIGLLMVVQLLESLPPSEKNTLNVRLTG